MQLPKITKINSHILDHGTVKQEEIMNLIYNSIEKNENYFILVHNYNAVLIGNIIDGEFSLYNNQSLEPRHILELRIFNNAWELHLIKTENEYKWRIRKDGVGNEVEIFDERHGIYGTKAKRIDDDWSCLLEERGTRIYVPFLFESESNQSTKTKLYYLVRNYIADEDLIKFEDARLVGFYNEFGEELVIRGDENGI